MYQSENELVRRLAVVSTGPYDKEANGIQSRLDTVMVRIDDFSDAVTQLSRDFHDAARDPLGQSTPRIIRLGEVVVQISNTSGEKRRTLTEKAQVSARSLSTTLQKVIDIGKATLRSGETMKAKNEELVDRVTQSLVRINELIEIADAWVKDAGALKDTRQAAAIRLQREIEQARDALRKPNGERLTAG